MFVHIVRNVVFLWLKETRDIWHSEPNFAGHRDCHGKRGRTGSKSKIKKIWCWGGDAMYVAQYIVQWRGFCENCNEPAGSVKADICLT